jgi:hypothetical protein
LGFLKSLVMEDDGTTAQPTPPVSLPTPATMPTVSTAPSYPMGGAGTTTPQAAYFSAPPPPRPQVDEAIRQRLEASLLELAPAGYKELLDDLNTLADVIPHEQSRFAAALKLAAKQGHTLDHLIGDLDTCIGVLETKGREFEDEIKRQIDLKVGARQKALQDIDKKITDMHAEVARLQSEIASVSEQRGNEAASITQATTKIEQTRENFRMTFQAVMADITGTKTKILNYGKG